MEHPGPRLRSKRSAVAATLSEAAFRCGIPIAKLSRFENAIGNLSSDEQRKLEEFLAAHARMRMHALQAAMQGGVARVEMFFEKDSGTGREDTGADSR